MVGHQTIGKQAGRMLGQGFDQHPFEGAMVFVLLKISPFVDGKGTGETTVITVCLWTERAQPSLAPFVYGLTRVAPMVESRGDAVD